MTLLTNFFNLTIDNYRTIDLTTTILTIEYFILSSYKKQRERKSK